MKNNFNLTKILKVVRENALLFIIYQIEIYKLKFSEMYNKEEMVEYLINKLNFRMEGEY